MQRRPAFHGAVSRCRTDSLIATRAGRARDPPPSDARRRKPAQHRSRILAVASSRVLITRLARPSCRGRAARHRVIGAPERCRRFRARRTSAQRGAARPAWRRRAAAGRAAARCEERRRRRTPLIATVLARMPAPRQRQPAMRSSSGVAPTMRHRAFLPLQPPPAPRGDTPTTHCARPGIEISPSFPPPCPRRGEGRVELLMQS